MNKILGLIKVYKTHLLLIGVTVLITSSYWVITNGENEGNIPDGKVHVSSSTDKNNESNPTSSPTSEPTPTVEPTPTDVPEVRGAQVVTEVRKEVVEVVTSPTPVPPTSTSKPKPTSKPEPTNTPRPKPTSTPRPTPEPNNTIQGLTSIRIGGGIWENWDSDAEKDGPYIEIVYLDTQGEIISTYETLEVPISADVKVYAGSDASSEPDELVFSKSYTSKEIIKGSSIYPKIRIPKEEMSVLPSVDYQYGAVEVTIKTPRQGNFSDYSDFIVLYQ